MVGRGHANGQYITGFRFVNRSALRGSAFEERHFDAVLKEQSLPGRVQLIAVELTVVLIEAQLSRWEATFTEAS